MSLKDDVDVKQNTDKSSVEQEKKRTWVKLVTKQTNIVKRFAPGHVHSGANYAIPRVTQQTHTELVLSIYSTLLAALSYRHAS